MAEPIKPISDAEIADLETLLLEPHEEGLVARIRAERRRGDEAFNAGVEAARRLVRKPVDYPEDCERLGGTDPETGVRECALEVRGDDCLCDHRREALEEVDTALRALKRPIPTKEKSPCE